MDSPSLLFGSCTSPTGQRRLPGSLVPQIGRRIRSAAPGGGGGRETGAELAARRRVKEGRRRGEVATPLVPVSQTRQRTRQEMEEA